MFPMLQKVPWALVLSGIRTVRRVHYTVPAEDEMDVVVERSVPTLEVELGARGYEPWYLLSARYKGEDLNMRTPISKPSDADGSTEWTWQHHVRAFDLGDGRAGLQVHDEPSPLQNPKQHVSNDYVYEASAVERLIEVLDESQVNFKPSRPSGGSA